MTDDELIDRINKAAFEVRRNLTPGYLESIYQSALVLELRNAGLNVETEVPLSVSYKNYIIGNFKADIIVEKRIIIELKAVNNLLPIHEVQLVNYLQTTGYDKGILINYGSKDFAFRLKSKIYHPKNKSH
ncbi:MAG: GxxExxY protein [Muribaculaceae bacterium]|nr:GxxExxY protein [Muribaculaceae bacterium]MDE6131526.1 GxxExxY protein [Muribaculaceae bacterium]